MPSSGMRFGQVRVPLRREQVRDALCTALRSNALQPGDRIIELRIAREMGVSQSVVREALRELEQMGLVESFANRGTYVRRVTRRDAHEIYSMRAELEAYAVREALPRMTAVSFHELDDLIDQMCVAVRAGKEQQFADIDVLFHRRIIEAADHRLLLRTWEGINPLNWTFLTFLRLSQADPMRLAERHRPVLAALRSGDLAVAQEQVRAHILDLVDLLLPLLES